MLSRGGPRLTVKSAKHMPEFSQYRHQSRYRIVFFFSSRRRHTRFDCDWSSDVCSSDLVVAALDQDLHAAQRPQLVDLPADLLEGEYVALGVLGAAVERAELAVGDADVGEIGRASCRERV